MEQSDFVGVAGVPGQGRYLVLYLKTSSGRVTMAKFDCHGCGVSIACGSALTELVTGRSLAECGELSGADLEAELDGIPIDKRDRAEFAIMALRDALAQWIRSLGASV